MDKDIKSKNDGKNIALIIAGGVGSRMGQNIPKQFLNVYDKPIIIHTLECFQKHPEVDAIVVVCLDGWHEVLKSYIKQFDITKFKSVVSGGQTGFESIINGTKEVERLFPGKDNIIMVHDAIRPNLSEDIISCNIKVCREKGNAVACINCQEAMLYTEDKLVCSEVIDRDKLLRTQTPQSFYVKDLRNLHDEAIKKGVLNTVASCTLMIEMGYEVHVSKGSEKNIKLTTPDDIEIFKALLKAKRDEWIK